MTKVLIADDNKQIGSVLEAYAKHEGYAAVMAYDGVEALEKFKAEMPDVVLLDVMMPRKDGFQVCREIRAESNVPIIMITARGEDFERIMGLDNGADDYIVKPFSPGEVMARIRAILRRLEKEEPSKPQIFEWHDLNINLEDYSVMINQVQVSLTKKEIEILWTLATHHNKVFSREMLLSTIWGYDYYGDNRTVDTHIKRLRSKLDAYPHPLWEVKTIRGVGYKFEVLDHAE